MHPTVNVKYVEYMQRVNAGIAADYRALSPLI